jgi:enoyl-CoA hydratase/carnithine racemase
MAHYAFGSNAPYAAECIVDPAQHVIAELACGPHTGAVFGDESGDFALSRCAVVARAIERSEYLSLRSKKSLGAIKRSVYFGGSLSLEEGLQLEHAEFVVLDQSKEAQQLMLKYIAAKETTGDLPLMNRKTYARALSAGRLGE